MSAVRRMRMSSLSLSDSAGKQTIEDFLDVGGGKVIPHSDIVVVPVPK